MKKHLDLGCGKFPRNPYKQAELYGVDIRDLSDLPPDVVQVRGANLSLEPIPFPDSFFDSVSAYDLLEHIPRVALLEAEKKTRFPFIELMNEVWRVLKPNGCFYAVTPCYPHELAFADPTHVNIISKRTLRYFVGVSPLGRIYGFEGHFEVVREVNLHPRGDYHPKSPSMRLQMKSVADYVMRRRSHLAWELRALKVTA